LHEELSAALLFIGLANGPSAAAQPVYGPQKSTVCRLAPSNPARSSPPRLTQAVKAAVIPDSVAGVCLDIVTGQIAESRPSLKVAWPLRHYI
jgi:hypothetical protein